MTATTQRTAETPKRCSGCHNTIPVGADYLEHEHAPRPGDDLHVHLFECLTCAARNGRGPLAQPEDSPVPLIDSEGIA